MAIKDASARLIVEGCWLMVCESAREKKEGNRLCIEKRKIED
jgi:hypothetical protein